MSSRTSAESERRDEPAIAADAESFRGWVRPHLPVMMGLANRLAGPDAEDVVQDGLVEAWRTRATFDEDRGTARSWLLMLTANAASRQRRTRRRRPVMLLADPPAVVDPQSPRDLDVRAAVDALSARQKLAVTLFYYLDLPLREVAAAMDCSEGTAKSTLADARARLRGQLQERQ